MNLDAGDKVNRMITAVETIENAPLAMLATTIEHGISSKGKLLNQNKR
ncbi:MAG: hypothetical protein ACTSXQ_01335 [Alphaproteobacteria bacterium]